METKLDYRYKFNDNRELSFESDEIRDVYIKIYKEWGIYLYEDPCDGMLIRSHKDGKAIDDLLVSMGFNHHEIIGERGRKFHHFVKGHFRFSYRDVLDRSKQRNEKFEYSPVFADYIE